MSYEKVRQAKELVIGTKQTKKAIELYKVEEVFVALDADHKITHSIITLCKRYGIAVTHVDSIRELGRACGIEVGASTVAILKT